LRKAGASLRNIAWGPHLDPQRIGVAGHSQGGFTALWIGGATVNEARFRAYLQRWKNDPLIPASLRRELPLDPTPALDVHDARVKAVFAMAPGDLPGFGMDDAGLRQLRVPTYVIVGARDTQAPPADNAEFAARYALHAQLDVMPGAVDHEIFVNECDQNGRDTWPEACIDAQGVDRAQWHEHIGSAAVRFFDAALDVVRSTPWRGLWVHRPLYRQASVPRARVRPHRVRARLTRINHFRTLRAKPRENPHSLAWPGFQAFSSMRFSHARLDN
jgi:predicted dienelactone hydrolase